MNHPLISLPERPRILLVRLSAVGDCIHTLPLLSAVRRIFPEATIGWAVQGGPAKLLDGHPYLDEILRIDRKKLTGVRGLIQIRQQLRAFRPDITLDPQGLTKSALLGWLSGAAQRIGLSRPYAREIAPWFYTRQIRAEPSHVVIRYLQLANALTTALPDVEFHVPTTISDQQDSQQVLHQTHMPAGNFALVNCGAGWASKCWPSERYARVCRHLGQRRNVSSLVVWHGAKERSYAHDVVLRSGGYAVAAPETSLKVLAELCRAARFFIGSDTGPLHLAAAMGTPCVALYGPTAPAISGPYGDHHEIVESRDHDRFVTPKAPQNHSMQDIDAPRVLDACLKILDCPRHQHVA